MNAIKRNSKVKTFIYFLSELNKLFNIYSFIYNNIEYLDTFILVLVQIYN